MKFKAILATALVAVVLSACSKDDNESITTLSEGTKSKLGISFRLPATTTRTDANQTTQNATAAESDIKSVSVYIFNAAGTPATKGAYSAFLPTDFMQLSDVWTLLNAKKIETVAGFARIYVGVNIPTALDKAYDSESALLAAVTALTEIKTDNNFTMFSDVQGVTLQGILHNKPEDVKDEDYTPYENTITVPVNRVVSKVVGSYDPSGNFVFTWKASDADQTKPNSNDVDVTLTYTPDAYGIYQYAYQSLLVKNNTTLVNKLPLGGFTQTSQVVKPFEYPPYVKLVSGHLAGAGDDESGRNSWTPNYICENAPASTLYGNTTYAYIATKIKISHAAEWDDATSRVVYKAQEFGHGIGATGDVFMVRYEGLDVVSDTYDKANKIGNKLNEIDAEKKASIYKYPEGYVHFRSYLNRYGDNDYRVGRNEFIHVRVDGINQHLNPGTFPGNPGLDDGNPGEHPVDPNKVAGQTPKPTDPTEPIDGTKALLNVVVQVSPWTYMPNSIILQ